MTEMSKNIGTSTLPYNLGAKSDLRPEKLSSVKELASFFRFIEVYITPDAVIDPRLASSTPEKWIVHAPSDRQYNLALWRRSKRCIEKTIDFASRLGADCMIVHPGFYPESELEKKEYYVNNVLENLKQLNERCEKHSVRLLLENGHYRRISPAAPKALLQIGSTPDEIKFLIDESGCGFVLDFLHAYYAGSSVKRNYKPFIEEFMNLKPEMFHLSDSVNEANTHLIPGKGNLDMKFFVSLVGNKRVTLEISPPLIGTYSAAIKYLRQLSSTLQER